MAAQAVMGNASAPIEHPIIPSRSPLAGARGRCAPHDRAGAVGPEPTARSNCRRSEGRALEIADGGMTCGAVRQPVTGSLGFSGLKR